MYMVSGSYEVKKWIFRVPLNMFVCVYNVKNSQDKLQACLGKTMSAHRIATVWLQRTQSTFNLPQQICTTK